MSEIEFVNSAAIAATVSSSISVDFDTSKRSREQHQNWVDQNKKRNKLTVDNRNISTHILVDLDGSQRDKSYRIPADTAITINAEYFDVTVRNPSATVGLAIADVSLFCDREFRPERKLLKIAERFADKFGVRI